MLKKDFTDNNLKNINNSLSKLLKNQDLDFCKFLIHDHKEDLSVTAKYDPLKKFCSISGTSSSSYYGVSPLLDREELVSCISKMEIQNENGLKEYITNHGEWFMVHCDQEEYLFPLAEYIVVCMASHFGIRIKMDQEIYQKFRSFLKEKEYSDESIGTMLSYSESTDKSKPLVPEESYLTIKGCPTKPIIEFLSKYKYRFLDGDQAIPLNDANKGKKKSSVEVWEIMDSDSVQGIDINEIYSQHVELVSGRVFYSGVLLKPVKIQPINETQENYKIQSLCIHFERTTFGTVCAFDKNLTEHPVLKDVKTKLIEMLQKDDCAKKKLNDNIREIEQQEITDAEASAKIIAAVNDYFDECFNVNQIGVSANIITEDGLMLVGQRSSENIDANKIYPGVNGNAEVADRNVSFYSSSVYEDYPTIRLGSDRIDFFGEKGRETYGELKLNLPNQGWRCCGIVLNGNMPKGQGDAASYQESSRRMQLNIILENQTEKTFLEIDEMRPKAAEAFETDSYFGVRVRCEENPLRFLWKTISRGIVGIVSQKDFIEAAVAIVLFLTTISRTSLRKNGLYLEWKELGWADKLTLLLSLLLVIINLLRFLLICVQYFRKRKKTRSITIFRRTSYEVVNKKVMRILRVKKCKDELYPLHPAAAACLRYYVDDMICDAFFPKDNR